MGLTAEFTSLPKKTIDAVWTGARFEGPFRVTAKFGGKHAKDGVYRQYIRGYFKVNDKLHRHYLCEKIELSETEYREDGCPPPVCNAYGYRSCKGEDSEMAENLYEPDMATGKSYRMLDRPGFDTKPHPGLKLEINLEFKGVLMNEETLEVLKTEKWSVKGEHTFPTLVKSEAPGTMSTGQHIHAELEPSMDGGWNGSLMIAGPDPTDEGDTPPVLSFQVVDADGNALPIISDSLTPMIASGSPRNRTRQVNFQVSASDQKPHGIIGMLGEESFQVVLLPE